MTIRYDLRKNSLVDEPNVYRGQIIRGRTVHLNELVAEIAGMGNTLTEIDVRGVITALDQLICKALAKSENVILPFCSFTSGIKGKFNGRDDEYDDTRHKIHPVIKAGSSLRQLFRKDVTLEKVRTEVLKSTIDTFIDINSGSVNSLVTPGGMGEFRGYNLKFEQSDTTQGIFFIAEDTSEYRVTTVGRGKPSNSLFIIPVDLTAGTYRVQVRARIGDVLSLAILKPSLQVQ